MILLNDIPYQAGAPEVSLLNRSFKYGDGLFESIRVYQGKALFVDDHIARLFEGMTALGFDFDNDQWKYRINEAITKAIQLNKILAHGRLRLHIYRSGTGTYAPLDNRPFYLLEAYTIKDDYYDPANQSAIKLIDYKDVPLAYSQFSGFKTASCLPYIQAARHARAKGVDDVVLFNGRKVSETSSANIFCVKKRKIYTPSLKSACLNGIMRKQLISLCKKLKLSVKIGRLHAKDLRKADELFITNSIRGIIPVEQYNNVSFDPSSYTIVPFLRNCLHQYIHTLNS